MSENKSEINGLGSILMSEGFALNICQEEWDMSDLEFSKLCRTCLRETTDNDLTSDSLCIINANGKMVRVYEMFEAAVGLQIESDDRLPHSLCSACLKLVYSSYTFRTQGQRADEILRSILSRVKEETEVPMEAYQLEEDIGEEDEIQEVIETSMDSNYVDRISIIDETEDESQEVIEKEILEIVQLDEAYEEDDKSEEPSVEVSVNHMTCPFCSEVFLLQRDIIQHYKDEHPKEKPYKCEECSATFAHIQSQRRHIKTHVASSKEKMCAICSRLFHRADDLKRHIRTHTDERPYPCPMCNKAFKQHTELKDHMLSHGDNKMYQCTICAKEWRSRNGWYLHMKAHQEGWDEHRKRRPKKKNCTKINAAVEQSMDDLPLEV